MLLALYISELNDYRRNDSIKLKASNALNMLKEILNLRAVSDESRPKESKPLKPLVGLAMLLTLLIHFWIPEKRTEGAGA